ncbi:hypothetical protein BX661DRAFT_176534 [Kickxella alabastrina]|uniref:uncharacterized protein n=1 Tax=Kickxella alabastrina TaxID=61397 RepID=UPI0022206234|nr:uncharacterized protein BX661DRAFT_176534 [Kickxella alabastrina]KAI7834048.1 hypothetical protein BX661DRAFT_176534 [Kickxella alabastrina]
MQLKSVILQALLVGSTVFSFASAAASVDWKSECTRDAITENWWNVKLTLEPSLAALQPIDLDTYNNSRRGAWGPSFYP